MLFSLPLSSTRLVSIPCPLHCHAPSLAVPQTALQLLEKSIHEKQDSVVALRKQLEEMKAANLKMQNQLKVRRASTIMRMPL